MELELPAFRAYRGAEPPRFASPAELECAKVLDYYDVAWEYEPRTFVLEETDDGRVTEAFTPAPAKPGFQAGKPHPAAGTRHAAAADRAR